MLLGNIKRANELESLINETKTQIKKWEVAYGLKGSMNASFPSEHNGWSSLSEKHIPFTIIRAVSLEGFKKDLATYEAELAAL